MAWDNRASRFPPAEKGLQQKRYRARQDVDALTEALRSWAKANPGQEPCVYYLAMELGRHRESERPRRTRPRRRRATR